MFITLDQAIDLLNQGEVVALPTETVYGLAASIRFPDAIKQIYSLKGRPSDNPLIVHVSSLEQALTLMEEIPPGFLELTRQFWPGPLTLTAAANLIKVPEIARAGLLTVAIRCPNHPLIEQVLSKTGPLVAPSANLSGRPSSTTAKHIEDDFGKNFPILDGGACTQGIESTILLFQDGQWSVGRLGALSLEEIQKHIQIPLEEIGKLTERPLCPGQKYRHYSPKARLVTSAKYSGTPPVVLGFAERSYPLAKQVLILGDLKQPKQIASRLYDTLRRLDDLKIEEAWVDMDFPNTGILQSVTERLKKAFS